MNVYGRQAGFGLEASISVGEVGLLSLSCLRYRAEAGKDPRGC
jgi:hypothetical protein